jgi:hypothetical protein
MRQYERSGTTQVAFCAARGLNVGTFRVQRCRLRGASRRGTVARSATGETKLVRVDLDAARGTPILLGGSVDIAFEGVTMRVAVGTDANYVAALISALRASSC